MLAGRSSETQNHRLTEDLKKRLLLYVRSSTTTRPEDTPDAEVHEKYIELMCKYQPDLVHSYLRNTENYRLEETLAVWTVLKTNKLCFAVFRR